MHGDEEWRRIIFSFLDLTWMGAVIIHPNAFVLMLMDIYEFYQLGFFGHDVSV